MEGARPACVYVAEPYASARAGRSTSADNVDGLLALCHRQQGVHVEDAVLAAKGEDAADGKTWAEHGTESGVAMENRSYYGKSTHATNESDLDLVIDTKAKLPADAKLILIVDADHPMIFSEIEPYADVILMGWAGDAGPSGSGFNIPADSYARIITGEVEPSGLLPMQFPLDMDAVERQSEDASRDMDCYVDADGNTYDFCFGLNWAGVIEDERVKTYKVAPLTKPEDKLLALKPLHVAPGRLTADLQMVCYLVEKRSLIYINCQSL